jgi:hypothetical protein
LDVQWRVQRNVRRVAEDRAGLPVALAALASRLDGVRAVDEQALAQREVAQRGTLKSALVRWKLAADRARAREEIDKIQREMMGGA